MKRDNAIDRSSFVGWLKRNGIYNEMYSVHDMQLMHVVYWTMMDESIPLLTQSAVMLRESISDAMHELIYDTLKDEHGGFPGIAQLIADAAVFHEANIPDMGESFYWPESVDKYAVLIYEFVDEFGRWPSIEDLKSMVDISVRGSLFDPASSVECESLLS